MVIWLTVGPLGWRRPALMSRSSAEPMFMPHAHSNSALRQGAVGGGSLDPGRVLTRSLSVVAARSPDELPVPMSISTCVMRGGRSRRRRAVCDE